MDVSVIIVTYNTCSLTRECINSIINYTKDVKYEIILIDNGSIDGSKEVFSNDGLIKYIYSEENLGFGKANNLGIQYALGKYYFFLNSDTLLKNNAIKIFFDFAENFEGKFGALGSILKDLNNENIHSYGPFINVKNEIKILFTKYLRFLKDKNITHPFSLTNPIDVEYITGADLFVPQYIHKELGGFDPLFFMYCEETDWQQRMADKGYRRIIIPGPEIIHLEGGSDKDEKKIWTANRMLRNRISKIKYFKKHFKGSKLLFLRTFTYMLEFPITLYLMMRFPNKNYSSLLKIF